jgi:hypothetical protein
MQMKAISMVASSPLLAQPTKVDYRTGDIKVSIGEVPQGMEGEDILVSWLENSSPPMLRQ